jgi:hypothetical protein
MEVNDTVYFFNSGVEKAKVVLINPNGHVLVEQKDGEWYLKNEEELYSQEEFEKRNLQKYMYRK